MPRFRAARAEAARVTARGELRCPVTRRLGLAIGAGRLMLGSAIFAAPVPAARALGVDTATAKRVAFVTAMMAARDAAMGAGALASHLAGRSPAGWLAAGAAADAADAVLLVRAARAGTLGAGRAVAVVGGAAVIAAAGVCAALGSRR